MEKLKEKQKQLETAKVENELLKLKVSRGNWDVKSHPVDYEDDKQHLSSIGVSLCDSACLWP